MIDDTQPPPALPPGHANTPSAAAEAALAKAYDALDAGDRDGAVACLTAALACDPEFPEANGALADLLLEAGDGAGAAARYRLALAGDPGRIAWHRGLAAACEAAGDVDGALTATRALLERRSDDAGAHRRLARLLLARGEWAAALEHAHEARFLDPHRLAGLTEVAAVFVGAGEPLVAAELLEPALRTAHADDPDRAPAAVALAEAWLALAEPAKARRILEALLVEQPAHAAALDMLAVMEKAAGPEAVSAPTPAFVRALFDRYADRFDTDLVQRLGYAGPDIVADALRTCGPTADGTLDVLDAGCGTGLAGPMLRPYARTLAGVDLSSRMLALAAKRGLYDRLEAGDLLATLAAAPAAWDLIAAVDVLNYLGDLHPVMQVAAGSLRPGGRFAFTLERAASGGLVLGEGRRWAHDADHLRSAAAGAGLEVGLLEPCTPRRDRGQEVPGWVAVLRRPVG